MFNSTIRQKTGICPLCSDDKDKPLTKGLCHTHYWGMVRMRSVEKQSVKVIEDEGLSVLTIEADRIFSVFVRLSAADKNGNVKCFTCDILSGWKNMQCGHYVKRGNLFLRWDLRNCRPQCSICNEYKRGNYIQFTKRLEKQNPGITDILMEEGRLVYKPTRAEVQSIIDEYSERVKKLRV